MSDQNEDRTRQVLFFSGEGSWPLRILRQNPLTFTVAVVLYVFFQMSLAPAQEKTGTVELAELPNPDPSKPPIVITLTDAIEQARKVDAHFRSALTDAKLAHEDRTQARNAILPTVSYTSQALLTQGNGGRTTIGRFVTNDGVHVYRSWGVVHEDLSPGNYLGTTYREARATAAMASAKAEIAKRGLTVTVTKLYYGLAVAQRKYRHGTNCGGSREALLPDHSRSRSRRTGGT